MPVAVIKKLYPVNFPLFKSNFTPVLLVSSEKFLDYK